MLRCTMTLLSDDQRLGLEDLLADLWHARRVGDLGRLALLFYSDALRWAQDAGRQALAERARRIIDDCPHESGASFLAQVDRIIAEMELSLSTDDELRRSFTSRPARPYFDLSISLDQSSAALPGSTSFFPN